MNEEGYEEEEHGRLWPLEFSDGNDIQGGHVVVCGRLVTHCELAQYTLGVFLFLVLAFFVVAML
jgi:hypothetical protein